MSTPSARPRLSQVVIDTTDARAAAEFWRELLGLDYRPDHEPPPEGHDDPAGRDRLNLYEADGTPRLAFQQVPALTPTTWPDHAVPVWLSGQEAAEYVGVSWPTLRQALLDHAIPHVRLGTRWKIDVAVLDEHLHRMADLQCGCS